MRRLLIRPGAIGDCIVALPALEHLKAEYTEVWLPSPVRPLIRFADRVQSAPAGIDLMALPDVEPPMALLGYLRTFDSIVSWYGSNRIDRLRLNAIVRCSIRSARIQAAWCVGSWCRGINCSALNATVADALPLLSENSTSYTPGAQSQRWRQLGRGPVPLQAGPRSVPLRNASG